MRSVGAKRFLHICIARVGKKHAVADQSCRLCNNAARSSSLFVRIPITLSRPSADTLFLGRCNTGHTSMIPASRLHVLVRRPFIHAALLLPCLWNAAPDRAAVRPLGGRPASGVVAMAAVQRFVEPTALHPHQSGEYAACA